MARWGLAQDEFADNGGWPHQIYVREARRMISDYVMTEHQLPRPRADARLGRHGLLHHGLAQRPALRRRRGACPQRGGHPGQPRRPVPDRLRLDRARRRSECANLLVPVCVSSSHIAYGSIRMEPVFMILGQSAATAACLAIDAGVAGAGRPV